MNDLLEFVKLITARLESMGIHYMITGSMAMAIYATPRMTRDIDLVVEIPPHALKQVVALFSQDCYIDMEMVKRAVLEQGMFNIIHNDWVIKADFIIKKDLDYRREEFKRRRWIDIEERKICVVAPEDLILSKLVWSKDAQSELQLRDVRQLLSGAKGLDWGYLKKWAKRLGVDKSLSGAKEDA